MQQTLLISLASAGFGAYASSSLSSLCTSAHVRASLPSNGTLQGIELIPGYTTASVINATSSSAGSSSSTNSTSSGGPGGAGSAGGLGGSTSSAYSYCNVTIAYTHTGKNDKVIVNYAFPSPSDYKNRFYVAGGGGYSLSSSSTGGLQYGAVGGATDAGYNAFSKSYDEVALAGNGSIIWDNAYMFGHQALGEMTLVGKAITKSFYGTSKAKLYTYFEGCSDGGREAMSQVQRWGMEYDGVVAGAPAFRYAQQQVNHVFPALVEQTMDYYPPPCELAKIVNATITACDPLDGKTDGVISRTDLCKLHFNLSSIVGQTYSCAAQTSASLGFGFSKRQATTGSTTSSTPAQNGKVTAKGVAVAQAIYNGLHNSKGQQAYLSWQIGSELSDGDTTYNNKTRSWALSIPSTGGEFVAKFVNLQDLDNISSLNNVTYDTMVGWMNTAYMRFLDSLQTTYPDLTDFQSNGGKLLHYHGESDPSVPSASSVHYWQSVRSIMYPSSSSDSASLSALQKWYQLYLVPGAAHCGSNSLQPNGPYPQDNMATIIAWVEKGVQPSRLNATVSAGTSKGTVDKLCQWPTRPHWASNTSDFTCVNDAASIKTWTYSFPAFKVPIY
ncbi:tannase and feruloyl esterase [Myriangium duriaei CBS 260.36]|uniref:Carboxylic ester hydrolase n=1 Tax=Myriangium duriaei CBS 260.36 TaxID=1168546 RepID=A0A9P4MEI6_9PEZI|nr:tannase and feruloyl esterase [Myriangium duriaei CBS 260.36]